jgi:hypothetical protein
MGSETITMEFLGAQQRRILMEMSLIRDEMSLFRAQADEVHHDVQILSAMAMPKKCSMVYLNRKTSETRQSEVNEDGLKASLEWLHNPRRASKKTTG